MPRAHITHVGFLSLLLAACHGVTANSKPETFDFVIAGGGTAGLVVANRLSELRGVSIAVVEPGPDARDSPEVQSLDFNFAVYNKSINWVYTTPPQPELGSRIFEYRAGKALGGTSAVNGMVYIRGDKAQYDAWETLGNKGWNWDSVFFSAKRGESFTPPSKAQVASGASYDRTAHGNSGPLDIGFPHTFTNSSYHDKASSAFKTVGLQSISDLNGGNMHGFVVAPWTVDRDAGVREDSARAYYTPVEARGKVKIIRGTVKRIIWARSRGKDAVADGVEYIDPSGKVIKLGAKREVILSASAYRSPLILEGSGIGNPKILQSLSIPTKIPLPGVGESLQDHPALSMTYALSPTAPITGRTPFAALPNIHDVFPNPATLATSTLAQLQEWAGAVSSHTNSAIPPEAVLTRFRVQHDLVLSEKVYATEPLKGLVEGSVNGMHVIGSCAMLPRELGGVVDARAKVYGTRNVRVVDASIIPMQLSGHTMAPVYAVAERAAGLIKADWE
ncbi:hypothetical protein N0V88_007747 [Collariella sp. IMI 366227]|nr:hypothetical protein N0V88_007747 [Collariella sp. IMI 366227]